MTSEYFLRFDALKFQWLCFLLSFTRILTIISISSALGGHILQGKNRITIAIILAFISSPQTKPLDKIELTNLLCLLIKEVMLGFFIGFITSIIFYGIQSSGNFFDTIRGETISHIFVPQSGSKESPFAQLYFQITIITFFATSSHLNLIKAIHLGFQDFPVFEYPSFFYDQQFAHIIENIIAESGRLFSLTLKFCYPFIIITLFVDIALGLINRFIPALQVFFIGTPIKMFVSIFIFFVIANILTQLIAHELMSNTKQFSLLCE